MEDLKQREKAPAITIVALVAGIVCIAFVIIGGLSLFALDSASNPGWIVDACLILISISLVGITESGIGALITGIIGLKRSKRFPHTSKKGVCFSVIAIAAGCITVLFIIYCFIVYLFGDHPHPL